MFQLLPNISNSRVGQQSWKPSFNPKGFYYSCSWSCNLCEGRTSFYTVFFLLRFTPCKAEQPQRGIVLQEKEALKGLEHTVNLFRKNLHLKNNFRLAVIQVISRKKAFYRQKIPEYSCGRKKTVDIDIPVTSKNGDRKIMRTIRIASRPPSIIRKWNPSADVFLSLEILTSIIRTG